MLAPHEIVVVGDRVFTDIVLAHHLTHPRTPWNRLIARLARASHHFGSALLHSSAAIGLSSYEMDSGLTASDVKVDWGKDSNWLLFGSDQPQKFSQ